MECKAILRVNTKGLGTLESMCSMMRSKICRREQTEAEAQQQGLNTYSFSPKSLVTAMGSIEEFGFIPIERPWLTKLPPIGPITDELWMPHKFLTSIYLQDSPDIGELLGRIFIFPRGEVFFHVPRDFDALESFPTQALRLGTSQLPVTLVISGHSISRNIRESSTIERVAYMR